MYSKEIGLVVQGPTNFCEIISACYSPFSKKVWVTWKDEPGENIELIKEKGFEILLIDYPTHKGNWNINLQCKSSASGFSYLKSIYPELQFAVKIRSDLEIKPFNELDKQLKISCVSNDIFYLGYRTATTGYFSKEYYFLDFLVGGSINELLEYWKLDDVETSGNPCPEIWLEKRYYKTNYPFNKGNLPVLNTSNLQIKNHKLSNWNFTNSIDQDGVLFIKDFSKFYFTWQKIKARFKRK